MNADSRKDCSLKQMLQITQKAKRNSIAETLKDTAPTLPKLQELNALICIFFAYPVKNQKRTFKEHSITAIYCNSTLLLIYSLIPSSENVQKLSLQETGKQ